MICCVSLCCVCVVLCCVVCVCSGVRESTRLPSFCKLILSVGNFLNYVRIFTQYINSEFTIYTVYTQYIHSDNLVFTDSALYTVCIHCIYSAYTVYITSLKIPVMSLVVCDVIL